MPYASRSVPASKASSIGSRLSETATKGDTVEGGCDEQHVVVSTRNGLAYLALGSGLERGDTLTLPLVVTTN